MGGGTYLCMLVVEEERYLPVCVCLTVHKEVLDAYHLVVLYHIVALGNISRLTLCCTCSSAALISIR